HLGQGDLPVPAARAILGPDVLIGRSTHAGPEAAAAAVQEGVDYFCTGPCWPTPTKPGRHAPGPDLVRYAAGLGTARPWFAIGGIDLGNLDEVLDAGARRVVVVRALTEADDPGAAAAEFATRLRQAAAAGPHGGGPPGRGGAGVREAAAVGGGGRSRRGTRARRAMAAFRLSIVQKMDNEAAIPANPPHLVGGPTPPG